MINKPQFLGVLLLLLSAIAHCHAAERITLMVSGMEKQIYLPAKLAERLGYLKETGLDIVFQNEPAGMNAETEMLSGAAQGVIGFYDHTIDLQARGKMVQSVVQLSQVPGEAFLVSTAAAESIRSVADIKGKTLGVTGLGSSTNFLTLYIAAKAGVKKGEFVTLPVGAGSTFIAAMRDGKIDAGMTTEPTISRLVASGAAHVLVDFRSLKDTESALSGTYPAACLYMPSAWISTHPEQVQKIVASFVKTLKFIRSHSAKEITEQLPTEYYASGKQAYIDSLAESKGTFTADGVMPENGPDTVLKVLNVSDRAVQGRAINLANTFTNAFVRAAR